MRERARTNVLEGGDGSRMADSRMARGPVGTAQANQLSIDSRSTSDRFPIDSPNSDQIRPKFVFGPIGAGTGSVPDPEQTKGAHEARPLGIH